MFRRTKKKKKDSDFDWPYPVGEKIDVRALGRLDGKGWSLSISGKEWAQTPLYVLKNEEDNTEFKVPPWFLVGLINGSIRVNNPDPNQDLDLGLNLYSDSDYDSESYADFVNPVLERSGAGAKKRKKKRKSKKKTKKSKK